MPRDATWHATPVLVRAGLGSAALSVIAVVLARPDLLVLAAPLLVHAVGAVVRRPGRTPSATVRLGNPYVREGDGTLVRVTVDGAEDVEHAVLALVPHRHVVARPASGVVGASCVGPGPAPGARAAGRQPALGTASDRRRAGRRHVGLGRLRRGGRCRCSRRT